jgi:hypothetical protein
MRAPRPAAQVKPSQAFSAPAPERTPSLSPASVQPSPSPPMTATVHKATPAPAPVVAQGTGVVAIGGEVLLRGEVIVDGISRGFAPTRLELPFGKHKLEVVTRDGRRLAREVIVSRKDSPSTPLTWQE